MTTLDPTQISGIIEAGRDVGLRYPRPHDRAAYTELRRLSRAELEPWEPLGSNGFDPYSPAFFDRQLESARTPQNEKLLIIRLSDGAIAGHMSIGGIIRGAGQMCHLGYWIGTPFAGRGYMKQAIGLTLAHCFDRLGLHRVEANIQPHNLPSIGVVKANGFRYEGLSKGLVQIQGEWRDHLRWAITQDEWKRRLML